MRINDCIKTAREKMKMSLGDAAKKFGLSRYEYIDIEFHEDEIFTVTPIYKAKNICGFFNIDCFHFLVGECAFCGQSHVHPELFSGTRSDIIKARRLEKGLSTSDLADSLGFEEIHVLQLENNPEYIETLPFVLLSDLSEKLDIPVQVLAGLQCPKCQTHSERGP